MLRAARNFVYYDFLRRGRAPAWADFMVKFGLSRQETNELFSEMEDAHDVVLLPNQSGSRVTNYILMSHPFSNIVTPHYAYLDRQRVNHALKQLDNEHDVKDESQLLSQHDGKKLQRFGN